MGESDGPNLREEMSMSLFPITFCQPTRSVLVSTSAAFPRQTKMATSPLNQNDDGGSLLELEALLHEQKRELASLETLETDLELAFQLQLQEALSASLSLLPSSSSSPPEIPLPNPPSDAVSSTSLQSEEISRLQQELDDLKLSQLESRRNRLDLDRSIHDHKLAREILRIPSGEWDQWGDNVEDPFERPSSSSSSPNPADSVFRLYFKGLLSEEHQPGPLAVSSSGRNNVANQVLGVGVAICDPEEHLVFEIRKPLLEYGFGKKGAECRALIEGLNAAIALELNTVAVYFDYFPLYQLVTGRWHRKQRKIAALVNQVSLLRRKFTSCNLIFVARNDIKHAFKLAREAIVSVAKRPALSIPAKVVNETCVICSEDVDVERMFSVDECKHRYCYSCMKQHVEAKLLHGLLPKCPHEGCKSELLVDSCQKFLTPKLIETMTQRIKEASIPVTERVYCPYPKCSALMSKNEVSEYAKDTVVGADRSGARKCLKCHGLFCINCKVPWHSNLTCHDYKRLNPSPPADDVKLKFLARTSLWRQCLKCNHMIELAEGCYHMTCRCGYEFCYNCGAEWRDKRATCSCPLWEEENIWSGEDERDFEDFEDEDDDYYDSDEDDHLF